MSDVHMYYYPTRVGFAAVKYSTSCTHSTTHATSHTKCTRTTTWHISYSTQCLSQYPCTSGSRSTRHRTKNTPRHFLMTHDTRQNASHNTSLCFLGYRLTKHTTSQNITPRHDSMTHTHKHMPHTGAPSVPLTPGSIPHPYKGGITAGSRTNSIAPPAERASSSNSTGPPAARSAAHTTAHRSTHSMHGMRPHASMAVHPKGVESLQPHTPASTPHHRPTSSTGNSPFATATTAALVAAVGRWVWVWVWVWV